MALGVVPARYSAERLPGKPLREIGGKPIIEWVYRQAERARSLTDLIVATDDERVHSAVKNFGGKSVLTSGSHASGTDRVAEVAANHPASLIVNIQADTPFLPAASIDSLIRALEQDESSLMASVRSPICDIAEKNDPHVVKVVCDADGYALYFSRSPLPYHQHASNAIIGYRHLGIYAFRRDYLLRFAESPPSPLEVSEGLEQLRALEGGVRIKMIIQEAPIFDIDTPQDLARARKLVENGEYSFPGGTEEGKATATRSTR